MTAKPSNLMITINYYKNIFKKYSRNYKIRMFGK